MPRRDGPGSQVMTCQFSVSIEEVHDPSLRAEIDAAFNAKYGWLGRLVIDDERAHSDDPYMRLIPAPKSEGRSR